MNPNLPLSHNHNNGAPLGFSVNFTSFVWRLCKPCQNLRMRPGLLLLPDLTHSMASRAKSRPQELEQRKAGARGSQPHLAGAKVFSPSEGDWPAPSPRPPGVRRCLSPALETAPLGRSRQARLPLLPRVTGVTGPGTFLSHSQQLALSNASGGDRAAGGAGGPSLRNSCFSGLLEGNFSQGQTETGL